jgi:ATP-binding cassette subfamily F protein uup
MDKMTEHLFVFEGEGKIKDINGNYSSYRALRKVEDTTQKKQNQKPLHSSPEKKKTKLSYKEKTEFEKITAELEWLESENNRLTNELNSGLTDSNRIVEITVELAKIKKEIDDKETRWLELSEFE